MIEENNKKEAWLTKDIFIEMERNLARITMGAIEMKLEKSGKNMLGLFVKKK